MENENALLKKQLNAARVRETELKSDKVRHRGALLQLQKDWESMFQLFDGIVNELKDGQ